MISAEDVRKILRYDRATGRLIWRVHRGPRAVIGGVAGSPRCGYTRVKIDGKKYQSTTLIWLIECGRLPANEIDHRDGDNTNDRWVNLREATVTQNNANAAKRKDNTSGFKGVSARGSRWIVQIQRTYIASCHTIEEAVALYRAEAERRFGEFARVE